MLRLTLLKNKQKSALSEVVFRQLSAAIKRNVSGLGQPVSQMALAALTLAFVRLSC